MADPQRCWPACTSFSCTRKGILLLMEMVLCLAILICFSILCSAYSSLSVVEMVLAAVFFLVYMCNVQAKVPSISWPWADFFRTFIAAILYLITSILVLVHGRKQSRVITAGVLGLVATCLFGYDAYITFPLGNSHT